ncbi:MAG: hypothetical protein Q8Q08_09755 [Candidatus Omnitrophota bacterium]|nr:hypothetical protein [Candidatus Omnitrophota bacterium]MDZ4242453.1 hypothetical protein [Candidatus Omnitrophota bacterium]
MNKLGQILDIPNRTERKDQLASYARALGIALPLARESDGELNEEKLAILIYDAQKTQKKTTAVNLKIALVGAVAVAGITALFGTLPKLIIAFYEQEEREQLKEDKMVQLYDSAGKPFVEKDQQVLYSLMEGVQKEYDEKRDVFYEFHYKAGQLVRKKELDNRGRVISDQVFNQTAK